LEGRFDVPAREQKRGESSNASDQKTVVGIQVSKVHTHRVFYLFWLLVCRLIAMILRNLIKNAEKSVICYRIVTWEILSPDAPPAFLPMHLPDAYGTLWRITSVRHWPFPDTGPAHGS
jgi:hypothetical protein